MAPSLYAYIGMCQPIGEPGSLGFMVDLKLELVNVPVSDVDRAKAFYADRAGFHLDHDHTVSDELRFVQLTLPGSACLIAFGTGLSDKAPGSVGGLQLVVDDIEAARSELAGRGVDVTDVQVFRGSFVFFSDPDGNGWAVQQLPLGNSRPRQPHPTDTVVVASPHAHDPIAGGRLTGRVPRRATTISNPARLDDTLGEAALGDAHTLLDGCRVAREAQPGWAATPAPVRGRTVQQFGRLVEENAESLARLITREIGKPLRESRGEVQEVVDTCNFFLSGRRLYGQTVPSEMVDKQLFTFRTPVGVAAIVTAGNSPVAVPSWYIVPALVAGTPWCGSRPSTHRQPQKPSRSCCCMPVCLLAFSMVSPTARPRSRGSTRRSRAISSTRSASGSTSRAAHRRARRRHLKTPCLELGGKNPLVVMPDADLDLAVEGALFSGFGTAGQRCTSLGTAIVHADVHDDFLDRFSKAVSQAPIGDPPRTCSTGP